MAMLEAVHFTLVVIAIFPCMKNESHFASCRLISGFPKTG
jgi:hypothetical protein